MAQTQEELKKRYDQAVTTFVSMSLSFIPIIGIPAFLAVYLGEHVLENRTFTLIFLLVAFILSWTLIIVRYRSMNKNIKDIEAQMAEIKKQSA